VFFSFLFWGLIFLPNPLYPILMAKLLCITVCHFFFFFFKRNTKHLPSTITHPHSPHSPPSAAQCPGRSALVAQLLAAGGDPDRRDGAGASPRDLLAAEGNCDIQLEKRGN
jgi:hypothetical protein